MHMLWPSVAEVDPADLYGADARQPVGDRPWVMVNMIASVDGAAADATGASGGLGGPPDKLVFVAIRAAADVVMAGASTVIAEDYGPVRLSAPLREARRRQGRPEVPRLAVVSASLRIEPDRRLFREASPGARPLVLTTAAADSRRRRTLAEVAEVVEVGEERVDWALALAALRDRTGAGVVLCEGGPSTNGQLVTADLVDEACVTLAPALVGGPAPRIARGDGGGELRRLALDRVLTEDGYLFLRYVRHRDPGPSSDPGPPPAPAGAV
jgi:riboflavin-specific deaminase-like protein